MSLLRDIMQELDFATMNSAIEHLILKPIAEKKLNQIPPVFVTACEDALASDKWIRKAFILLLFGYASMDFRKHLFEHESSDLQHVMLTRCQLFFDGFLKGWRVENDELVQFKATDSIYPRSYGWIMWELRSFYLQL